MKHLWSITPFNSLLEVGYVKDPYSSNRKATISSKLHCAPNSRLTYYSDSRMYQVCPVVEFWSRCSLLIMHGAVSPNLEGKNKASMFNYLWTNICCYHRTELSTYSLFLKPKKPMHEKEDILELPDSIVPWQAILQALRLWPAKSFGKSIAKTCDKGKTIFHHNSQRLHIMHYLQSMT